ncbi:Protein ANTAGONIST OF LIKE HETEROCHROMATIN PROTEIN 1 [Frankliniella fusca]|uniref:Protein ANTAGONIST OF LIKE HETEROCHROMATIN PROTEIN 1 n=1 Tax=Frankliniella fusca TaxID=407009 RepID=A0AAE1H249_9NEOP|nr:Protein ANTAGONIST OF LIKE HETEROCHROMATIN PROTEIN 1 [Frankliniella fusca]
MDRLQQIRFFMEDDDDDAMMLQILLAEDRRVVNGNDLDVSSPPTLELEINVEGWRRLGDPTFRSHFRMDRPTFEKLVVAVGEQIEKDKDHEISFKTPVDVSIMIGLWVLFNGDFFRSVSVKFNISKGVAHYHYTRLIKALHAVRGRYIAWPNAAERDNIQNRFFRRYGYPGVVGAIDGTHIYTTAPLYQKQRYVNRHHTYSLLAQAVCDDKMLYRDVYAGEQGSVVPYLISILKRSQKSTCNGRKVESSRIRVAMAMAMTLVDCELLDVSTGAIYVLKVDPKDVDVLDNDNVKRFRILNDLKSRGKKPDRIWDSLIEESTKRSVPAKNRKGSIGVWDDAAQWALLTELIPHRLALRSQRYAVKIWAEVSTKLETYDLPEKYSPEQVAEKVRLMKRTWKDVKQGKRKKGWEFTDMMAYIFEKPIEDEQFLNVPKDMSSVGSYTSYLNALQAGANSSSIENSPAQAECSTHGSPAQLSTHGIQAVRSSHSIQLERSAHIIQAERNTGSGDTLCIVEDLSSFENSLASHGAQAEESTASGEDIVFSFENEPATRVVRAEQSIGSGDTLCVPENLTSPAAECINSSPKETVSSFNGNDVGRGLFDFSLFQPEGRAQADDDDEGIIVLFDSEEIFIGQMELKKEPSDSNNNYSDIYGDEIMSAKETPNKVIVPCRMTPKGRSPQKKNKKKGKENTHVEIPLADEPRTPVKKKSKSTGGRVEVPASPAKTPKRKAVQKNLVWPARLDDDFVRECVARKTRVQQFPETSIQVWKDVAAALNEKGHIHISWDLCRAKFEQLNNFFINTVLKLGGKIGTNKWSHYKSFLEIHDIPPDVDIPENVEIDTNPGSENEGGGRKIWTDRHIMLLLDCYKLLKDKFNDTKSHVRHSILYAQISTIMNQFEGVEVSGKQCAREMNDLRSKFFQKFDNARGTGRAPSQWKFFKPMREIFDGDANLDAPFTSTVGTGLSYTARGKEETSSVRNTRTRPPCGKSKAAKENAQETTQVKMYKGWPQQIQQKQLEQRQALLDEVRLLRVNFDMRSAERMQMLKAVFEKL